MVKLVVPAAFTEFFALDTTGGTLLCLRILLEPKGPEVKSSEELSILNGACGSLGLAATARLRRVTKRPAEGRRALRKSRGGRKRIVTAVTGDIISQFSMDFYHHI